MERKAIITITAIDDNERIRIDFDFVPNIQKDIQNNPIYDICSLFMKALKEKADKIDVKNLE